MLRSVLSGEQQTSIQRTEAKRSPAVADAAKRNAKTSVEATNPGK